MLSWLETYGFVYVVTDGTAYKIGETSGCVYDRIANMQSGNPRKLEFVHCYETADRKGTEKYLHEQLAGFRVGIGGTEWFSCTLDDIDEAAEEIEVMFGAVKAEPFKLVRTKGEFTRDVVDYWVMGDTLTLQLEWSEGDHRDLNITLDSKNKRSKEAGAEILKDLRKLLKVANHESMMHKLRHLPMVTRDRWVLTYRRKRAVWLDLNDFELVSMTYRPMEYVS